MDWVGQAAGRLREMLAQPWLDAWQPTIAQTPDWALLAAAPAFLPAMKWRILIIGVTTALAACSPANETARTPARFSLEQASASTLRVVAVDGVGRRAGFSSGSGVAVAPNMVLTNAHVIAPFSGSDGGALYVLDNAAGFPREVNAVITLDARLDLALLYVRGIEAAPVTLALSIPRQLEPVTALGFPGATDDIFGRMRDTVSATSGEVTAVDEGPVGEFGPIQLVLHTATVNPGNSGGPLFNACGELVGINTLRADPGEVSNAFVASAVTEITSFLESYGVEPAVATSVCSASRPDTSSQCSYDRTQIDAAIEAKSLEDLEPLLTAIPSSCPSLANEAWAAHRSIAREAVSTFLAMSGAWRLPEQRCADRVTLNLSGAAVWGVSGDQAQFERLTSIAGGAVTTKTAFPEEANPHAYRYSLVGDRLTIENLTTNSSWEMERCSG